MINTNIENLSSLILKRLKSSDKNINDAIKAEDIATIIQEVDIYQAELLAQNELLLDHELYLRETKEKSDLIFQEAPIVYVILDKNHFIREYNRQADKLFHLSLKKQTSKSFLVLMDKEISSSYFDFMYGKTNEDNLIIPLLTYTGEHTTENRYYKLSKSSFTLQDKNHILLSITDMQNELDYIEKIKNFEKEKKEIEKLLLLQSKTAAVGEMLGNIAHQWRQPLSAITTNIWNMQAAIDLQENITNEDILECSHNITKYVDYLSQTIEDFRNFFKADTKQIQPTNITHIVKKTSDLVFDSLKDNFIQCHSDIEDFTVNVNDTHIVQAIINICNNAKDALCTMDPSKSRLMFMTTYKHGDFGLVKIRDNAGGISSKALAHLFEPYFTTKHPSIGTGIGLYMTYQIITKHYEGRITAQNVEFEFEGERYKGAEFTIVLLLSDSD